MKKIVVQVIITCSKCTAVIMSTVAKLEGIKSITIDVEKSTLTVVGNVDPVCIISVLKKKKKCAIIMTVEVEKKPEPPKVPNKEPCKIIDCCTSCSRGRPYVPPYGTVVWQEEPQYGCIIS